MNINSIIIILIFKKNQSCMTIYIYDHSFIDNDN